MSKQNTFPTKLPINKANVKGINNDITQRNAKRKI